MYNATNYTLLFNDPQIQFNSTAELGLNLVNGSGRLTSGYLSSYCRIEGFDLLMQLEIVQTVILLLILLLMSVYVGIYVWRYITHD